MKVEDFFKTNSTHKKYVKSLLNRVLITAIVILSVLIICNLNSKFKSGVKKYVFETNYNFSKINTLYKKYLLNLKKETDEITKLVSNNKLYDYTNKVSFKDGVLLTVGKDYPIKTMESGIIVFIGKKDDMDTVIMEQSNGIDVVFGNVLTNDIKIYDFVEKERIIGNTNSEELYLSFQKNKEVLNYEPYIES